jgi:hypothetical protein
MDRVPAAADELPAAAFEKTAISEVSAILLLMQKCFGPVILDR